MRYLTFKSFNNENKQLKVRRDFTYLRHRVLKLNIVAFMRNEDLLEELKT